MTITTTVGESFTEQDSRALARLVCRRFGHDVPAAAAAWRRLLQNSCSEAQFKELLQVSDLDAPAGLSAKGLQAYKVIVDYLTTHGLTYTGGCRLFYAPGEWRQRGERYGQDAELIVVYDGAAARRAINLDSAMEGSDADAADGYALYEGLQAALGDAGLYVEECTTWYAAVYAG